jgi:hypothetical protein
MVLALTAPAVAKHRRPHHRRAPQPKVQPAPVVERPDDGACTETLKNALAREAEGQLRGAEELFRSCARPTCTGFAREQCAIHFKTLESDVPTVVLVVSDTSGASRSDVRVRVDGALFAAQVDGRPLPIDPGLHDFSFSTGDHVFATQKVLILQGQRNRFITAIIDSSGAGHVASEREQVATDLSDFPRAAPKRTAAAPVTGDAVAPAAPAAEATAAEKEEDDAPSVSARPGAAQPVKTGGHRLLPYLIGGVGVASLGAGALLTYWGRKDNDMLGQCAPNCAAGSLQHIRRVYYEADAAIGVGVAALAAAYLVYAINHGSPPSESSGGEAMRFGIEPTRSGGGVASVFGAF